MKKKADIGMIGLAVMGTSLARNMAEKGFTVAVYDVMPGLLNTFRKNYGGSGNFIVAESLPSLANALKKPRKVMMMIRAGKPVDEVIEKLLMVLEAGDMIIDGGNSNFQDTIRRTAYVESKGLFFIGTGVSGGEEGALNGPSLMPGGSKEAWPQVKDIFQKISAKVEDGTSCADWIGDNGAGHFVKMVHNGIEYGDMQLISEAYFMMKKLLGMAPEDMHEVFAEWNKGELDSYLIEITADIMAYKDEDGEPLVEKILDTAGQKGTGKWTGIAALEEGIPLTLIVESVFARALSAQKEERVAASKVITGPQPLFTDDKEAFIEDIRKALYASKIISYAQGYTLLREAARTYHWDLNFGRIALLWRGGCIIRSTFLVKINEAYAKNPALPNLILDPYFRSIVENSQDSLRKVVSTALNNGIPVPTMAAALTYFDGYRTDRLPANLLQAQRDYFGAHTYERIDRPRGEIFHTNWTGHGGDTASTTYNA